MITLILMLTQIGVAISTMMVMLYTLYRMVAITREARMARAEAIAATVRAEEAARLAAAHAADGVLAISKMADNVQKIELATNSMKDALVKATAAASHLEGREEMRAEAAAKKEGP